MPSQAEEKAATQVRSRARVMAMAAIVETTPGWTVLLPPQGPDAAGETPVGD